jgi:hypothetical protein
MTMRLDLKEIQEGIISLSSLILLFSLTLIVVSILFKPYLVLKPSERDYIVAVSAVNFPFCIYYIIEAKRASAIRNLQEKYIINFIIRTSFVSLLYIPHLVFMGTILFKHVNVIEKVMVVVIVFLEFMVIGLISRIALWKLRNRRENK